MTDEQQSRKSARGRRAKKRDEDILEESGVIDANDDKPTKVTARSRAASKDDAKAETTDATESADAPKKPRRTRSSTKKSDTPEDEKKADAKEETPKEKPAKKSRKKTDEKASKKADKKDNKKDSKKADKKDGKEADKKADKKESKKESKKAEKKPKTKDELEAFQATENDGNRSSINQLSGNEAIEFGVNWLNQLLAKMKLDLNAEGRLENGGLIFNITGPDRDTFLGTTRKSPRALISIQTLLSEAMPRFDANDLIVDLGGFQKDRQQRLEEIAKKLGETSRAIDKSITVAGLNNFERKVIHQALADDDDLETESVDHGIFRKLRVYPD